MAPRRRLYGDNYSKQRAYEDRLKGAGRRRVCVWIGDEADEQLKELTRALDKTRAEVVEELILATRKRKDQ